MGDLSHLAPIAQLAAICTAIRAGNYAEVAARYAGISEATYYRWMQRGGEDSGAGKSTRYCEFREAIKKAEADAEVRAVSIIQDAMPDSWQAAMTYLERKYPQRWGRGDRVEHSGPDVTQAREKELAALSREELVEQAREHQHNMRRLFVELDKAEKDEATAQ